MSQLSDAALAALEAEHAAAVEAARERLRVVLVDAEGSASFLSAVTVRDTDPTHGLTVFGDGTVFLAVAGQSVKLVTGSPGEWVQGPEITSLVELGRVLAAKGMTPDPTDPVTP